MMKKKKWLTSLVLCAMVLCGCKTNIRFGTAPRGGLYYELGQLIAEDINATEDDFSMSVRETAGSAANVRLLSEGYIRMGIAQADIINTMYYDTNNPYKGYSAVTALYTEAVQIAVLKSSNIQRLDDLEGKNISIGQDESGTQRNAIQILSIYGIDENMFTVHSYNYEDAMKHLLSGSIDAMFITAGSPISIYEENSDQIELLSLEDTKIERLVNNYPYFVEIEIPSGTYSHQEESIYTVGIPSILLASDEAPKDSIEELTRMYFENVDTYEEKLSIDLMSDPEESVKHIPIPLHQGAKQYYESLGVNVEDYGA